MALFLYVKINLVCKITLWYSKCMHQLMHYSALPVCVYDQHNCINYVLLCNRNVYMFKFPYRFVLYKLYTYIAMVVHACTLHYALTSCYNKIMNLYKYCCMQTQTVLWLCVGIIDNACSLYLHASQCVVFCACMCAFLYACLLYGSSKLLIYMQHI